MSLKHFKSQKGFSLPEVLMATVIISISIVAMVQTLGLVAVTDTDLDLRLKTLRTAYNYANLNTANPSIPFTDPPFYQLSAPAISTTTVGGAVTARTFEFTYTDTDGDPNNVEAIVFQP